MVNTAVVLVLTAFSVAAIAGKDADAPARIASIEKLSACRAITDGAARLACFDREVAAFDTAVRDRKVAVIDQEDMRKTRRTLFGIALPRVKLFGDAEDGTPEIKEVTATIKATSQGEGGRIVFTLEDGAIWAQTDDYPVFYSVNAGQKVTLKRASFGSYFADFEKSVTVRAKRLR
jgi:DNA primase large subunit